MALRAQLAWLLKGSSTTNSTLDALSLDLRELQQKVVGLEGSLEQMRRAQQQLGERQLDELDRIRGAVAAATDDLVERVNAVDARVQGSA
jgi:hypothetical protein